MKGDAGSFPAAEVDTPFLDKRDDESGNGFCDVKLVELFERDRRLTFVIDLRKSRQRASHDLAVVYCNPSLRSAQHVYQRINTTTSDPSILDGEYEGFTSWSLGPDEALERDVSLQPYAGLVWSYITVRDEFRIISADGSYVQSHVDDSEVSRTGRGWASPDEISNAHISRRPSDDSRQSSLSVRERQYYDWINIPLAEEPDAHRRFVRSRNWAATPLGPMENWDWDLISASDMTMRTPYPAAMYWGPKFITMYNEAYVRVAGKKHPELMGKPYSEGWSEIWDTIKPVVLRAWEEGETSMNHNDQLFMLRDEFLEETFFSWTMVPLLGANGQVMGLFNAAFENTQQIINERRLQTLRTIGEQTATAETFREFWTLALKGLGFNENDVPFCLVYSVGEDLDSDTSSLHSGSTAFSPILTLEGTLGVPDDHPVAAPSIDTRTQTGFAPYMRQSVAAGGQPILLSKEDNTLPLSLVEGVNWRGFGDPCRHLVVFPVNPIATYDSPYPRGFIVLGVNPRRPYDDDYQLFVQLLSRQLATSLASVVLFEEQAKRIAKAARLAAMDREHLSLQLQLRTQEAVESEYKFSQLAEFAPVGIFIANTDGSFSYCNDMWWQISRMDRIEDFAKTSHTWMHNVVEKDRPALQAAWEKMLVEKSTMSIEFRFKCSQRIGNDIVDTWVLMSAYPESHHNAAKDSIFGCVTDISIQKRAEKVQNDRRKEAIELKRQQENFIDITSHEMRNPLSAILQCVDEINSNITEFSDYNSLESTKRLHDNCLDAANTIGLCASHQKRIVDDVLTLSKLDAKLISITPTDAQPLVVVEHVLKMFQPEIRAHDIQLNFHVDQSYHRHQINWVTLDPSRLQQVLINCVTNAIKFTHSRKIRTISISVKAYVDMAELQNNGTTYFEPSDFGGGDVFEDKSQNDEGQPVFLHFTVQDSGSGINDQDLKALFQRFRQATPRTHVQYGGSGLGLFISRILVEMQGGQIGVVSQEDEGSSFYFYIQGRRAISPPTPPLPSPPAEAVVLETKKYPQTKISVRQVPDTLETPVPRPTAANPSLLPAAGHYSVLIVEDNVINQRVLDRQLKTAGNKTYTANHGMEALSVLEGSKFWAGRESDGFHISVILMDLEMPVMDGLTCTRRIRELERNGTITKHIPIIAVTAYARPEQVKNAQDVGMVRTCVSSFFFRAEVSANKLVIGRSHSQTIPNVGSNAKDTKACPEIGKGLSG